VALVIAPCVQWGMEGHDELTDLRRRVEALTTEKQEYLQEIARLRRKVSIYNGGS
jgi:cell division protein FtsB